MQTNPRCTLSNGLLLLFAALSSLLHLACSPESTSQDTQSGSAGQITSVDKIADLACSSSLSDRLVFDSSTATLYLCKNEVWNKVSLSSEQQEKVENSLTKPNTLLIVSNIEAGQQCPQGGKLIASGIDQNNDGKLTADDGDFKTDTLCNGATGEEYILGTTSQSAHWYDLYRSGIFRMVLTCKDSNNVSGSYLATAWRCAATEVCTAKHAIQCGAGETFQSLSLSSLSGSDDSVTAAFANMTASSALRAHTSKDVGKININNMTDAMATLPIETATADASGLSIPKTLTPILSMSYPLGFVELHTDISYVVTADLTACDQGKYAGCGAFDFVSNNNTDHGSSGGPLIDVYTGKIVGIVSAGTEAENANFTWASKALLMNEVP